MHLLGGFGDLLPPATLGLLLGSLLHGLEFLGLVRGSLPDGHLLTSGVCLLGLHLGLLDHLQGVSVHLGGKGDVVLQLPGRNAGRRLAELLERHEDPVRVLKGQGSAFVGHHLSIVATGKVHLLEDLGAGLLHQIGSVEAQSMVSWGYMQRLGDRFDGLVNLVALILRLGEVKQQPRVQL